MIMNGISFNLGWWYNKGYNINNTTISNNIDGFGVDSVRVFIPHDYFRIKSSKLGNYKIIKPVHKNQYHIIPLINDDGSPDYIKVQRIIYSVNNFHFRIRGGHLFISTNIPKQFNNHNLFLPEWKQYKVFIKLLLKALKTSGVVTKLKYIQISSLHIAKNIIVDRNPSEYFNLFEDHVRRRARRFKFETRSVYIQNKTYCLCVYDKSKQMWDVYRARIEPNILRMELRFRRKSIKGLKNKYGLDLTSIQLFLNPIKMKLLEELFIEEILSFLPFPARPIQGNEKDYLYFSRLFSVYSRDEINKIYSMMDEHNTLSSFVWSKYPEISNSSNSSRSRLRRTYMNIFNKYEFVEPFNIYSELRNKIIKKGGYNHYLEFLGLSPLIYGNVNHAKKTCLVSVFNYVSTDYLRLLSKFYVNI